MGEMMWNSLQAAVKCNAFASQNGIYAPNKCEFRTCKHYGSCLDSGSSIISNRSRHGIGYLYTAQLSMKGYSWFRCIQLDLFKRRFPFQSNRIESNLLAVGCNKSRLVLEENEGEELVERGEDGINLDFSQKISPPWGNFEVQGLASDNEDVQPSLMSEKVVTMGESRLHFLKEREEDGINLDVSQKISPPWGKFEVYKGRASDTEAVVQPSLMSEKVVTMGESRLHFLEESNEEELSRRLLMLSRSNKVRSSMELFKSMEFSGLRATRHACNSLLLCLLRNKLLDNALTVFYYMETNGMTTEHTYSLILKAVASTQGCNSALDMFVKIQGYSGGKKFDTIVYNTMISICGRVQNWVETERIWKSMKEHGHHGTRVTYSLLVSIFVRCGRNKLALDVYNEMIQNGFKPKDDTMQAIIGACSKEGNWSSALSIFQNMLNHGLKPNLVSCNALINSLGKAGEVKLAFEVFETLKSLGYNPDAYTWYALLNGLYRTDQHGNALHMFDKIIKEQRCQLNEHIYNTALMSCQKLSLWERALQILWQLEASGESISTLTYNIVIGACEVARKPKVALQVYEHMVHQGCIPDTFTYLLLIRGCIWASLWSEVHKILDVAPDVSIYNAVIRSLCLRGQVGSAKKLHLKMQKSGLNPDDKTRALMLQNLRKKSPKKRRLAYCRRYVSSSGGDALGRELGKNLNLGTSACSNL